MHVPLTLDSDSKLRECEYIYHCSGIELSTVTVIDLAFCKRLYLWHIDVGLHTLLGPLSLLTHYAIISQ